MRSMTGYGKAKINREMIDLEIEIKSVNSRFLDLRFYLPRDLSFFETSLRKRLGACLGRGAIEVRINLSDHREPKLNLNKMKLKKYHSLVKEAIDTLELTQDVPLEFLINEPGVLESNNSFADDLQLKEIVSESIELAIADFKDSTIKEGQEIRLVLEESLSLISNALSSIEASLDDYRALLYENMKKRILELTSNLGFENLEQRILQELAIYIDKYDIQEEITRLWTHLETFRHNLSKADDQEVGKTLNFIVQEMHREANTMGSKYSTSNSFKYILTIKEEIEKCKEIVQNVA